MEHSGLIISFSIFLCNFCSGSELELYNDLFAKYNNKVRPIRNASTVIHVGVQLQILNLLEVNGKEEYIKMALFFKSFWHDEYLTWDPKKYDGIDYIRLPATLVWLPDFCVVTSSNPAEDLLPKEETLIGLNHTGAIDFAHAFVLINSCPMDSEKFPFDTQSCLIKPNTEWEIFHYTNESKDWHRELSPDIYRQVWYTLKMKRSSTYYVWVIIVPTFMISALSIAGIFAPFNNAGDRSEKVTLGLTTLLTLAVILSLVTGEMPKGMKLPILGIFVLLELIICTSSMAVSVVILYLHQRATTRALVPPKWLMSFMKSEAQEVAVRKNTYHYQYRNSIQGNGVYGNGEVKTHVVGDLTELRKSMAQLTEAMTPVRKHLEKAEEDASRKEQWGLIFDRIDMMFFIGFQVINALTLVLVYVQSF